MATLSVKTKYFWNDVWNKLSAIVSTTTASPFNGDFLAIEEPLTLYVETTGNDIVADKGATVQIGPTATLGATNELSVDGVAGTLATLRAASPRVYPLTPNPYNTYIYE